MSSPQQQNRKRFLVMQAFSPQSTRAPAGTCPPTQTNHRVQTKTQTKRIGYACSNT
jgi:hypothetical protein